MAGFYSGPRWGGSENRPEGKRDAPINLYSGAIRDIKDATERKVGGRSQESQHSLNKNSVGSVCLNSGEDASSDVHQSTGACTRDHESVYPCSLSTPLNNLTQISHKRLSTESGLADLPMGSSFPGEPPMSLHTTLTHFMIEWHRAF